MVLRLIVLRSLVISSTNEQLVFLLLVEDNYRGLTLRAVGGCRCGRRGSSGRNFWRESSCDEIEQDVDPLTLEHGARLDLHPLLLLLGLRLFLLLFAGWKKRKSFLKAGCAQAGIFSVLLFYSNWGIRFLFGPYRWHDYNFHFSYHLLPRLGIKFTSVQLSFLFQDDWAIAASAFRG